MQLIQVYPPDSNPENEKKDLHNTWINDWKYFVTD